MPKTCSHVSLIQDVTPKTDGCEECLKIGDKWVSLRLCLICGHVGCCNNSKNKHAQKHFNDTKHPIIQAFKMSDDWKWCYIDNTYVGKRPNVLKFAGHVLYTKLNRLFQSK